MSRRTSIIFSVVACIVGVVAIIAAFLVQPVTPKAVGADGDVVTRTIASWKVISMLLSLFGGGSLVAAVNTVLAQFKTATTVLNDIPPVPIRTVPKPGEQPEIKRDIATDTVEVIQAAINFNANRGDKAARIRFFNAFLTELNDIAEFRSPAVAKAMNDLGHAIVDASVPGSVSPLKTEGAK